MVRIKICGLTNLPDALAACEAGADFLGFNFYEKSPRYIPADQAAEICPHLPDHVEGVGVFVNAAAADITSLCTSLNLAAAQLHGDESPATLAEIASSFPVVKAFNLEPDFPFSSFAQFPSAFAFLLDAARAGQYGGTGLTTDWDLARRAAAAHRIILAGGLKPENVAEAIQHVRPYGVDVATGVESAPGKKDHGLIREFIAEVRRVEKLLETPSENALPL